MGADFSGYATKAGLKCADGRTIMPDAFKHMDGKQVPLIWSHHHDDPENVLGHAKLEARPDGVYATCFFNETPRAQNAKLQVQHGDITSMSIYANKLVEKSKQVFHGVIREVSLVLAGANPGAVIDYVSVRHGDGDVVMLDDEAVIYTGLTLQHGDGSDEKAEDKTDEEPSEEGVDTSEENPEENSENSDEDVEHADTDTLRDIYDSMNTEQKNVVHYMVAAALKATVDGSASHKDKTDEGDDLNHQEGNDEMTRNVFEQTKNAAAGTKTDAHVLTHDAMKGIVNSAVKGGSLKEAVEAYALEHGIENLEILFPDAKELNNTPEFDKRRTEWVSGVLNGTKHSPFARVKTTWADITMEEARAKGYIKGNFKKEEFFSVTKRTTGPTMVYKKQKLDRQDIIDITDFDVVAWMKAEMRLMLEEELARAILIGDGREVDDEDKIKDPAGGVEGMGIRSILHDHDLFAVKVNVNLDDANSNMQELADEIVKARVLYKGTGTPTMYTTEKYLTAMLLTRDQMGRRLWRTADELASELRVAAIVPVEVMEDEPDLVAILVNLQDYNIGADKGGETSLFDDFDIDYNQYKYLIETYISGSLTKLRSALVIKKTAGTNVLVAPNAPTFNESTGVVTVPSQTGVVYKDGTGATLTSGAQAALDPGESMTVVASPASGYYFASSEDDEWTFKRPSA